MPSATKGQVVGVSAWSCVRGVCARALRGLSGRAAGADKVERLEERAMLTNSALPTMSMLENASHPVVRFETGYGDVDIELFSDTNPLTVANFLNYVRSGRLDDVVFHRKTVDSTDNIEVLQGGGFFFDNVEGLQAVSTDAPVNLEIGTGRSNVAQTISMARTSASNSGTSQFFFNLNDNTNLDPNSSSAGYAVFGRVIQGWANVQAMHALTSTNISSDPAIQGDFSGAFSFTPVTPAYNQTTGVRESTFAKLTNAEIIKPQDFSGFFTQRGVMPEGFTSATTSETVEMFNPNAFDVQYKLVAHYEALGDSINFIAGGRDQTLSSGTLAAGTTLRVKLSSTETGFTDVTTAGRGYSLVLDTAAPEAQTNASPITASFIRSDFGGRTAQAFINPAQSTDAQLRDWSFARLERDSQSLEYVLIQNLSDVNATITITLQSGSGTTTLTRVAEPYRRTGVALAEAGLSDGIVSVHITSTQNIAATASDWTATSSAGTPRPAVAYDGATGGGATSGTIAGLSTMTDYASNVSVYNPSSISTVVNFTYWRTGGTAQTGFSLVALPGVHQDIALSTITGSLTNGERVTVSYDSGSIPVVVSATTAPPTQTAISTGLGDGIGAAFSTKVGTSRTFAAGSAPDDGTFTGYSEVLSLFNPYASTGNSMTYTVTFNFSDGTSIIGATGTLTPNGRIDLLTTSAGTAGARFETGTTLVDAAVRTKIQAQLALGASGRKNYGITVTGTVGAGGPLTLPVSVAPVALLSRFDTLDTFAIADSGQMNGSLTALAGINGGGPT